MAYLTVVFSATTSVQMCRNVTKALKHRIVWENPWLRRFIVEVPDGQEWAWARRYKTFTAVRAVFYECSPKPSTP